MLSIYRRHVKSCPHRSRGRAYRRCKCPVWVDGTLDGDDIRESLKTRNWQKAQETVRHWEYHGRTVHDTEDESHPITVAEARTDHLADLERRVLSPATLRKYQLLWRRIESFCNERGIRFLIEFETSEIRQMIAEWPLAPQTQAKHLEQLKAIFRFARESNWIEQDPCRGVKPPSVKPRQTRPFSREEMTAILAACDQYPERISRGLPSRKRLRALVLMLRYSGLRIGDAVTLEAGRLQGERLLLYTAKTGVPVHALLPEFVVSALAEMPRESPAYFFWSGLGSVKTVSERWRNRLAWVFKTARISNGHPHRFRDTFAVELLLAGVPIDRVSILLGHKSVRVTEKHYAPWVRARQNQLEADLRQSWTSDPICQKAEFERARLNEGYTSGTRIRQ